MDPSVLILTEHAVAPKPEQGVGPRTSGSFPLGESLRAHGCHVTLWKPGYPDEILESDRTQVVLLRSNDREVLRAAESLETRRVPVINPTAAARAAADKWVTFERLTGAGIPTPPTSRNGDPSALAALGARVVAKPRVGSRGRGVIAFDLDDVARHPETEPTVYQRFVEHEFDWRLVVVDGRVVLARRRVPQHGEFRTNVSLGATVIDDEWPDDATVALGVAAASALGCSFCGVDVIPTPNGPLVIEVNAALALRNMTPRVLEVVTSPLVTMLRRAGQTRS